MSLDYMTVPAFQSELQSMRKADQEGKVNGLWNLILNHVFPSSQGYVHRPQDQVTAGYVDIHSVQWVQRPTSASRVQCQFLITQCKRQEYESQDRVWAEGYDQLEGYLRDQQRKHTWPHNSYGIVAVGRYVQIYQWIGGVLNQLTTQATPLHVQKDRTAIIQHLTTIKNNHT